MKKASRRVTFTVEYDPSLVLEKDILPIFKRYDGDKTHIIIGVSDMYQLHIDDLAVTSESLSTGDLTIENLNYHYDNDLDQLFINSDEILSNIKIYDLLGKEVISKAININSASIDLTNLNDAIYIVNVKSRNSRTSTFKIVKN